MIPRVTRQRMQQLLDFKYKKCSRNVFFIEATHIV